MQPPRVIVSMIYCLLSFGTAMRLPASPRNQPLSRARAIASVAVLQRPHANIPEPLWKDSVSTRCAFVAGKPHAGKHLVPVLASLVPPLNEKCIEWLCSKGRVAVNAAVDLNAKTVVEEGMLLEMNMYQNEHFRVEAEDVPLEILFEDEHMLAVRFFPTPSPRPPRLNHHRHFSDRCSSRPVW